MVDAHAKLDELLASARRAEIVRGEAQQQLASANDQFEAAFTAVGRAREAVWSHVRSMIAAAQVA